MLSWLICASFGHTVHRRTGFLSCAHGCCCCYWRYILWEASTKRLSVRADSHYICLWCELCISVIHLEHALLPFDLILVARGNNSWLSNLPFPASTSQIACVLPFEVTRAMLYTFANIICDILFDVHIICNIFRMQGWRVYSLFTGRKPDCPLTSSRETKLSFSEQIIGICNGGNLRHSARMWMTFSYLFCDHKVAP